jgi:hypothetical protein
MAKYRSATFGTRDRDFHRQNNENRRGANL